MGNNVPNPKPNVSNLKMEKKIIIEEETEAESGKESDASEKTDKSITTIIEKKHDLKKIDPEHIKNIRSELEMNKMRTIAMANADRIKNLGSIESRKRSRSTEGAEGGTNKQMVRSKTIEGTGLKHTREDDSKTSFLTWRKKQSGGSEEENDDRQDRRSRVKKKLVTQRSRSESTNKRNKEFADDKKRSDKKQTTEKTDTLTSRLEGISITDDIESRILSPEPCSNAALDMASSETGDRPTEYAASRDAGEVELEDEKTKRDEIALIRECFEEQQVDNDQLYRENELLKTANSMMSSEIDNMRTENMVMQKLLDQANSNIEVIRLQLVREEEEVRKMQHEIEVLEMKEQEHMEQREEIEQQVIHLTNKIQRERTHMEEAKDMAEIINASVTMELDEERKRIGKMEQERKALQEMIRLEEEEKKVWKRKSERAEREREKTLDRIEIIKKECIEQRRSNARRNESRLSIATPPGTEDRSISPTMSASTTTIRHNIYMMDEDDREEENTRIKEVKRASEYEEGKWGKRKYGSFGQGEKQKDTEIANSKYRPILTDEEIKLQIKYLEFPEYDKDAEIVEFYNDIKTIVEKFSDAGIPETMIAGKLFAHMAKSTVRSEFIKKADMRNLDTILAAIRQLDPSHEDELPTNSYLRVKPRADEKWIHYIVRVEEAFDRGAIGYITESQKTKAIKQHFFKQLNVSSTIQLLMTTVDDLKKVAILCEDYAKAETETEKHRTERSKYELTAREMWGPDQAAKYQEGGKKRWIGGRWSALHEGLHKLGRGKEAEQLQRDAEKYIEEEERKRREQLDRLEEQRQEKSQQNRNDNMRGRPTTTNQRWNTGYRNWQVRPQGQEQNANRPNSEQHQQQQQQQQQNINVMERVRRAEPDFERRPENAHITICLNCRQVGTHRAKDCKNPSHCTYCGGNHRNEEHVRMQQQGARIQQGVNILETEKQNE